MKVDQRVQDKYGFTGTVTADYDNEIEVTWDISGCASDVMTASVVPMVEGQDDPATQERLHQELGLS